MVDANVTEQALIFDCAGAALYGVLHQPATPAQVAVLIVVGGPQYRVGSHRQFILLARYLAERGVPVMRFDYRGMGDSEGEASFEHVDDDIAAAAETLCREVPGVQKIVLVGLCDGASASLFYAPRDERVQGLVLLNPWVRTAAGEAKAYVKHYYLQRLLDGEFWKKLLSGRLNPFAALGGFFTTVKKMGAENVANDTRQLSLPDRMGRDFEKFTGATLFVLSGNQDYVADEFRDLCASSPLWRKLMARPSTTMQELAAANHTFSTRAWRDEAAEWIWQWLQREMLS